MEKTTSKNKNSLRLSCDRAISGLVRSKGFCERCGKKNTEFDTAHVYSRKNLTLRWDIFNLLCLCRECHLWNHSYPKEFMNWFKEKFPGRYFYLQIFKNRIHKEGVEYYSKLLIDIQEKNLSNLIQKI